LSCLELAEFQAHCFRRSGAPRCARTKHGALAPGPSALGARTPGSRDLSCSLEAPANTRRREPQTPRRIGPAERTVLLSIPICCHAFRLENCSMKNINKMNVCMKLDSNAPDSRRQPDQKETLWIKMDKEAPTNDSQRAHQGEDKAVRTLSQQRLPSATGPLVNFALTGYSAEHTHTHTHTHTHKHTRHLQFECRRKKRFSTRDISNNNHCLQQICILEQLK
jgi:hypothetical protein